MRDIEGINKWMIDAKLSVTKIADALDCHHSLVSNTISNKPGRKNNRRVLRLLIEKGCPVEFLDLPADMKEAA